MRRIFVIFLTAALMLVSACSPASIAKLVKVAFEEEDSNAPQKVFVSTASQIMFDSIIEALDNEDSDALKSLFSLNAATKETNLDEQITDLMEFYKGKLISNSNFDAGSYTGEKDESGWIYLHISPAIRVLVTDEAVYSMGFNSVPANNDNPDDVGLWWLVLGRV